MSRARILSVLSAVALALGLGLAAVSPASAAPQLSTGCATAHSRLGQTFGSAGTVAFTSAAYSAGEELVIVGIAGSGVTLDVEVGLPNGQSIHFPGVPGQKILIPVTVSANYTFKLSGKSGSTPAFVTWAADCGVPPTPVISEPAGGGTYYVGQQVPTAFGCSVQTNPLASCTDSKNAAPPSSSLDTSALGPHTYTVTAVDSSGLLQKTSISYTVVKQPQTLHFTTAVPTGVSVVRDSRYFITVMAESTSGLPVEITTDPNTPACGLTGTPPGFVYGNVDPAHAGTCRVFADQAGTDEFAPAERISMTFEIAREPTWLTAAKASKGALGLSPTTFRASLETNHWFGPSFGPAPFHGEQVSFSVGGKQMCTATTVHVDDGTFFGAATATCKATIGLPAALKYKSYTATYAGSQDFEPSTATGVLQ